MHALMNPMERNRTVDTYHQLLKSLSLLIEDGRKAAVRNVNSVLITTYWFMGRRIVEYEQKGKERAKYGEATLLKISRALTKRFGNGFSLPQLKNVRQFYLSYPLKSYTASSQSEMGIEDRSTLGYGQVLKAISARHSLSWSHYCLLMRIEEPIKRDFYEKECIRGNWSVRQLNRQAQSLLFERTGLSRKKELVIAKANLNPVNVSPEDEIKDPYVLEFLGLKDEYSESQLEESLIKHLENFLLELGVGFAFVARQKRITFDGNHYRIDLLLYHRVLRCLVLVDLKIGDFNHADAGQMNFYLNWAKHEAKLPGENDPVGIILCSDKNKTYVQYALGGMNNRIFVSQYRLKLPKAQELKRELERGRNRFLHESAQIPLNNVKS